MTTRAYLDHNATTPLHPAARDAMVATFEIFGNPSSVHAEGRRARGVLDSARRSVSALVGCAAEQVIFTSGGTEALNIALTPDLGLDQLLIGAGEHPAVFAGHRFDDRAETVAHDSEGRLDLAALALALQRHAGRRVMLALQAANNETGVVQPVRAAADMVHAAGGYVVCDAVQAVGKIACDMTALGADALALSAHKFGGPKGVGALCFAPSAHHLTRGVVRGGGQERGLRGGTENLAGIAGLGAACEVAAHRVQANGVAGETGRLAAWRDAIELQVSTAVPNAIVFGRGAERLPNTTSFALPGVDAQVLLMSLDLAGVAVSAGSACAAGKSTPSHVLAAMGVPADIAVRAVRVSLGWTTRDDDIARFADAFAAALRTMRPRVAA